MSKNLKRVQTAMKPTNKKRPPADPIAEFRKNDKLSLYSKSARVAVRLAVEVYEKRKIRGFSQIDLAKKIGTTQKVISNIENGDVNIGIDLLKRLVDGLGFSNDDLGSIFESNYLFSLQNNTANVELHTPQHQSTKYPTINHYTYETTQR